MMGNFMLAAVDRIVRMALWCIVVYARRRTSYDYSGRWPDE